uniref:RT06163p n=1 Tax=Drosophila melanogaster TaxID=7227 RepID=D3PFH4_DROME|nr:RT06163p [Drosophila melanogaster]
MHSNKVLRIRVQVVHHFIGPLAWFLNHEIHSKWSQSVYVVHKGVACIDRELQARILASGAQLVGIELVNQVLFARVLRNHGVEDQALALHRLLPYEKFAAVVGSLIEDAGIGDEEFIASIGHEVHQVRHF